MSNLDLNLTRAGFILATLMHVVFAATVFWQYRGRIFDLGSRNAGNREARQVPAAAGSAMSLQAIILLLLALSLTTIWAGLGWSATSRIWAREQWAAMPLLDALRYGAWFVFMVSLLKPGIHIWQLTFWRIGNTWLLPIVAALWVGSIIVSAIIFQTSEVTAVLDVWRSYSFLFLSVCGLILVEQLLRNVSAESRWGALPVCLGLATVFGFDLYAFSQAALLRQLDLDAFGIRAGIHALAVPLLFIASRRHQDWLRKLHVSRQAVFHSAALLLIGLYFLVISALGYYVRTTGGNWGRGLELLLVVAAMLGLLVVALSGAMRAKLRVYISKNFFSYRYDYRQEWLRFTAMLSSQASPTELGNSIVMGLANLVESPGGALWLNGSDESTFRQVARWNSPSSNEAIHLERAFFSELAIREWVAILDEWRSAPGPEGVLGVPEPPAWLLNESRYWLCMPLMAAHDAIGWVVLERPRTAVEVNWEVRDLLKTAGRQASSYLVHMQSTEALLESRKFDAFNKMSAFVVHDLKNIVAQLSLMMRNAKRLKDNPEFQEDMLATVENSLEKMKQLMLQLREGEKPHGILHGVDLAKIAQQLAADAHRKGRELELQLMDMVSSRGHENRVERVIGHAVQNAFDATPPDGHVCLTLRRQGSYACVEVQDTGCGMSEEFVRTRFAKPFQTTKEQGMGIGAFESFQYLHELGGQIEVASQEGRGTQLRILFPLFFGSSGSDLNLGVQQ